MVKKSKNNPNARKKILAVMYKGEEAWPVALVTNNKRSMVIANKAGALILDSKGNPIPWSAVQA